MTSATRFSAWPAAENPIRHTASTARTAIDLRMKVPAYRLSMPSIPLPGSFGPSGSFRNLRLWGRTGRVLPRTPSHVGVPDVPEPNQPGRCGASADWIDGKRQGISALVLPDESAIAVSDRAPRIELDRPRIADFSQAIRS